MRRPAVIANWKMNKTISEALQFVDECRKRFKEISIDGVDVVVSPPFTAIKVVSDAIGGNNIGIAAQNLYWEEKGAYTGEVSASMLADSGCKYVIIGHSERRHYFGETDEGINKKIMRAIHSNLSPVFCVGETLQQREDEETFRVIREQVEKGLDGLSEEAVSTMLIAYEPVWAIGTGKNATPQQAEDVHKLIRKLIGQLYSWSTAEQVVIQYGGSVKADNAPDLLSQPNIDGALVGGACLKADSFTAIIKASINLDF